jgi:hypothetical protein
MRADAVALVALLGLAGTGAHAGSADSLTAVVTGAEGQVTAEGPDRTILQVATHQVIPSGWEIAVPAAGSVRLVCSDDHLLILEGPERFTVSPAGCREGRRLAPGTYRTLAPGDRTLVAVPARDAVMRRARATRRRILRVETRGLEEDDPRVPVLLDPRETSILEARPELRWTEVSGAREYVLRLVGPAPWSARLEAEEVDCRPEPYPPTTLTVCSAPWPEGAPDLPAGAASYLSVGATRGIARRLYEGESHRLRRLPVARAEEIRTSLETLARGDPASAGPDLKIALFLSEHDLLGAAASSVRNGLADRATARGFLLQGSLYLDLRLPRAAYRSFREASCRAVDLDVATEALRGAETARRLTGGPR